MTGGPNANMLFGGVDSLLVGHEDSQDWWLKDQSSLANGFENWVDPNIDWASMGLEVGDEMGSNGNGYQDFGDAPGNVGLTNGFSQAFQLKQGSSIASNNGVGIVGQQYQATVFDDEMYSDVY
jgi:hypothetical protein